MRFPPAEIERSGAPHQIDSFGYGARFGAERGGTQNFLQP
ncbi:MAG: hypothetical protein QOD12_253, partial [Verrucomicrobiota bacterium]